MKKVYSILMLIMLVVSSVFGQESKVLTFNDDTYSYEKVFDMPGKSKDVIYESIKSWVIKNIKTGASSNYFDDKDKSIITTLPAITVSGNSVVEFKVTVEIKEGKYRLSAETFTFHSLDGIAKKLGDYSGLNAGKRAKQKVLDDVDDFITSMIGSIQSSIGAKKADW